MYPNTVNYTGRKRQSQLTGYKLFPMVWNVIESLELSDLPVVAVTADGASHNWHFFTSAAIAKMEKNHPFQSSPRTHLQREMCTFFCDPSHLIKTTRNCFTNSFAHKMSQELKVATQDSMTTLLYNLILIHRKMVTQYPGSTLKHYIFWKQTHRLQVFS